VIIGRDRRMREAHKGYGEDTFGDIIGGINSAPPAHPAAPEARS